MPALSSPGPPRVLEGQPSPSSRQRFRPWEQPRPSPALQPCHRGLAEFLAIEGRGYNAATVADAVRQANAQLEARQLAGAAEAFGVAYELARLTFDYRPLLFDLSVRRALCFSMLATDAELRQTDDGSSALSRVWDVLEVSERVVPNTDVVKFVRGLASLRVGLAKQEQSTGQNLASADDWMAAAVRQLHTPEKERLQNFVDCLSAHCALFWGDCDSAIAISSQVLSRASDSACALLVRGDAYKFHASGLYERESQEDYAAMLRLDPSLLPLAGAHFSLLPPTRLEELTLRFHPTLCKQGPRPYEEYPMYQAFSRRQYFVVVAWVLHFVGKLKSHRKSTLVRRSVEAHSQSLWRAVKERGAALAQRESSAEGVWGPADPDNKTRPYRRYWLEMPSPLEQPRSGAAGKATAAGDASADTASRGDSSPAVAAATPPAAASPGPAAARAAAPPAAPEAAEGEGAAAAASEGGAAGGRGDGGSSQEAGSKEPEGVAAVFLAKTGKYLPDEPFVRMGGGWGDDMWIAKALQCVSAHEEEETGGSRILPSEMEPRGLPPDVVEPAPPAPRSWLTVQAPGAWSGEPLEVELNEALRTFGLDAIPDWFPALDRIYELTEPVPFASPAEQAVCVDYTSTASVAYETTAASRSMMNTSRTPREEDDRDDERWESTASQCGGWRSNLRTAGGRQASCVAPPVLPRRAPAARDRMHFRLPPPRSSQWSASPMASRAPSQEDVGWVDAPLGEWSPEASTVLPAEHLDGRPPLGGKGAARCAA